MPRTVRSDLTALSPLKRSSDAVYDGGRAIRIARHDGYVGTPFMAYEGQAEAFEGMGQTSKAESLMLRTLAEVRREKMWEHEGQDLEILGEFAEHTGHPNQARNYFEQAVDSAERIGMCRVVAESYFDLAQLSEKSGHLAQAADETRQGARYMSLAGDTIYLPRSLDALAALKAQTGHTQQAHELYQQAEAVIDEMLGRVPGAYTESSLLSFMSDTYLADFTLAADENNAGMAFKIIERARGRTVADMMRDHEAAPPPTQAQNALESKVAAEESDMLGTTDRRKRSALFASLDQDEETLGYFDAISEPVQRRFTAQHADLAAVQRSLQPDEAVLEYVVADPSSFCLAFDQKTAEIVKLPAGKQELGAIVSDYVKRIGEGHPINDRRIKAVGTVGAVNIGSMFRNGWSNNVKDADATPLLQKGSDARTGSAGGGKEAIFPLAPMKKEDAPTPELAEAWEYYHTPRAQYPTAPGYMTARSLNQIITYDAYNKAGAFLTQPLLMVVGSEAGSKWMSDDLMKRAGSKKKELYIVKGANHMSMYDGKNYIEEAASKLAPFFKENLSGATKAAGGSAG
jgi:fermentation-respiration switch protein FrsA (DUF1100 family)/tetratricopeptide (TPR) repeat protein